MKHQFKTIFLPSLLIISIIICTSGCGKSSNETTINAMNTEITITAYGSDAKKGVQNAADVIKALDTQLDTSKESSSISRLNNSNGQEIVVPGQFIDMYNVAATTYNMTDGNFDISVFPIINAWGFNSGDYHKPSEEQLTELASKTDFNGIQTNYYSDSGSYTMTLPKDVQITFDGISRGCATESAINQLQADGIKNAIVSMPGTVQTMGEKPDGSPWKIAVGDPDDISKYLGYIQLSESCMSTTRAIDNSFIYEDGTTYSHIIDPTTGAPCASDLKEVVVIADDAMLADSLSTGLYVMGSRYAIRCWRANQNFDMIIVTVENKIMCTSGLTELFSLNDNSYELSYIE